MRIFFLPFSFPPQMGNKVKVRQDFLYSYSYNSGRRRASVGRSGFERERERERGSDRKQGLSFVARRKLVLYVGNVCLFYGLGSCRGDIMKGERRGNKTKQNKILGSLFSTSCVL